MSRKVIQSIFSQVKISSVKKFNPIGYRCYVEIVFENGYTTSANIFENKSNGCVKDSHLGMVIPDGTDYIAFKVNKKGFGNYNLSQLSLKLLEVC